MDFKQLEELARPYIVAALPGLIAGQPVIVVRPSVAPIGFNPPPDTVSNETGHAELIAHTAGAIGIAIVAQLITVANSPSIYPELETK